MLTLQRWHELLRKMTNENVDTEVIQQQLQHRELQKHVRFGWGELNAQHGALSQCISKLSTSRWFLKAFNYDPNENYFSHAEIQNGGMSKGGRVNLLEYVVQIRTSDSVNGINEQFISLIPGCPRIYISLMNHATRFIIQSNFLIRWILPAYLCIL